MALRFEQSFLVKAPADRVWSYLTDPYRVAAALPGASVGEKLDERTYSGTMTVKLGTVSSTYKGTARFERLDPQERVTEIVASGQDVRGKGGAEVRMVSRLVERSPGETEVSVVSEVNVAGLLAQLGRGMIQQVSEWMFQVFTQAMRAELETPVEPAAQPAPPEPAPPERPAPEAAPRSPNGSKPIPWAIGSTGAAAVFLAAVAYALQIALDASTASVALTMAFLAFNVLAWWLGYAVSSRRAGDPLGRALLMVGDVIFPLNLFAPIHIHIFPERVSHSISTVLLIGLVYHLPGYLRLTASRFPPFFYPYFFAGAGGVLLFLGQFTLGLRLEALVALIVVLGAGLQLAGERWDVRLRRHFSLAVMALLVAATAAAGLVLLRRPTPALLGALFAQGIALAALASRTRGLGPVCRLFGLAAYVAFTIAFTASLSSLGASPSHYVLATTLWVCALTVLSVVLRGGPGEPFRDSAHWLAFALGLGLTAGCAPSWAAAAGLPLPGRLGAISPFRQWPPGTIAAALAPLGVGGAFLLGSLARWRNPVIAPSLGEFIVSATLLNVASYLAPLLLPPAAAALWSGAGWDPLGTVVLPLLFGLLYFAFTDAKDVSYPVGAFRLAGSVAVLASALIALVTGRLVVAVCVGGALVFLWRSLKERALWPHGLLLALGTAAAMPPEGGPSGHLEVYPLCVFSLALLGVSQWIRTREGWNLRAWLSLASALTAGAGAGLVAISLTLSYSLDESQAIFPLLVTGGAYLLSSLLWKQDVLRHAAAGALIVVLWLLGLQGQVTVAEFYLTPLALYLCLLLYLEARRRPPPALAAAGQTGPREALLAVLRANPLPLAIVAIAIVFPFLALVASFREVHAVFLAAGSLILLQLFGAVRPEAGLVYPVCALFLAGVLVYLVLGAPSQWVSLSLVLVGSLNIGSLALPLGRGLSDAGEQP
jgi:carbon monoxide dehydrogenase subunit G